MSQIIQFLTWLVPLLLIALKVGGVIGGTGSVLEAVGRWRGWPKFVAVGQKLEALGADIPKLVSRVENLLPPAPPSAVKVSYVPERSRLFNEPPEPPAAAFRGLFRGARQVAVVGLFAGLLCAILAFSCTPSDVAAEKKALADANAKLNQYCDARAKALTVLQPQDGGAAGAKP